MEQNLRGYQRAALLRQAHHLDPVAHVGKAGLTPQVAGHVDRELSQHELIKVRFTDFKAVKREITEQLSRDLRAILVGVIGNVGILYRQADREEDRAVELPRRKDDEGVKR